MYNLDQSQWAHNLSNANEKWVRQITVEISTKEMIKKANLLVDVLSAINNKRIFALYGEAEGIIAFDPVTMTSKQSEGNIEIKYDNETDFYNGIKLAVICYSKIHIAQMQINKAKGQTLICQ